MQTKIFNVAFIVVLIVSTGCASTQTKRSLVNKDLSIATVVSSSSKDAPLSISVGTLKSGHLVCYHQNNNENSRRLYSKHLKSASRNTYSVAHILKKKPFILTSSADKSEKVACFLTSEDIYQHLPENMQMSKFEEIPFSLEKIKSVVKGLTEDNYSYVELVI